MEEHKVALNYPKHSVILQCDGLSLVTTPNLAALAWSSKSKLHLLLHFRVARLVAFALNRATFYAQLHYNFAVGAKQKKRPIELLFIYLLKSNFFAKTWFSCRIECYSLQLFYYALIEWFQR